MNSLWETWCGKTRRTYTYIHRHMVKHKGLPHMYIFQTKTHHWMYILQYYGARNKSTKIASTLGAIDRPTPQINTHTPALTHAHREWVIMGWVGVVDVWAMRLKTIPGFEIFPRWDCARILCWVILFVSITHNYM